jgi:Family of unknown function (DUF6515)
MRDKFLFIRRLAIASFASVIAISPLVASNAGAQAHERHEFGGPHEFGHPAFHTPHWVFDERFHHDHFYPALGYSVSVLPPGHVDVTFGPGHYFFHAGVWYERRGPNFVVVRPPVGIVVPVLPPAYSTVMVAGIPYYYANDIYYDAVPNGYQVIEPPVDTPVPAPPQTAAVSPASAGNWYYCESTKSYYPHVTECKEGWRTVPATPPQRK